VILVRELKRREKAREKEARKAKVNPPPTNEPNAPSSTHKEDDLNPNVS
jgi:hypothetical protein